MTRCLAVSVGTTLLSAALLVALSLGAGVPAGTSNVIAVCCGIVPSRIFANRSWVWKQTGRGSVLREVAPFWILSLAGLVLSTIAVSLPSRFGHRTYLVVGRPIDRAAARKPSVCSALWVVQFVVLDRVIFTHGERVAA